MTFSDPLFSNQPFLFCNVIQKLIVSSKAAIEILEKFFECLETRNSILEPRSSMLDSFEYRGSSFESRLSTYICTVLYIPALRNIACGYASQDVKQHIQDWQVRKFRCYFLFSIFPWNMAMELALQLFGNWLSSMPCSKKPKHEFREERFNLGPVFFTSLEDGKRIGKF